jgi:tetratricopeptide (TPR) repeat protein
MQFLRDGKILQSVKAFEGAIKEDPQFALAYARLAEANSALAHDSDAEQFSRKAMDLSQDLPLAERYLIEANHARILKDTKKAIDSYENLAKTLPDNADVNFALGDLYLSQGIFDKARAHYASVLKNDPKNLNALLARGWLEVRAGNPQAGLEPLNRALNLAIELDNQEQKAQILQATGNAYRYLNKPEDALGSFQASVEINRKLGKKGGVANSLADMAQVLSLQGKTDAAMANFKEALDLDREIGAKKNAADTLIDMGVLFEGKGQFDKALQLYKESLQMQRDLGDALNQALCLNNIGNVYLEQGKSDDALIYYQQALQLREKLGNPADIAQTLHNLGEGYLQTAQYENAMNTYLKALDLRRKSSDPVGAGLESNSMGMVFLYQGRYGAAVKSLQDAVTAYENAKDRSSLMAEILKNYAQALNLAGQGNEAVKPLDEAEGIAKEIKNEDLQAAVLATRGDNRFYLGDFTAAKNLYQQSQQMATSAKDQENILQAKLGLAKVAIAQGQAASAAGSLRQIVTQADAAGLKYISVDASVSLVETMVAAKDYPRARQELEKQLGISDKLGLRMQIAPIQFLLGEGARLSGNTTGAPEHYRQAITILDEAKKDPGAEKLFDRPDLKAMYDNATHWANFAKN